MQKKVIALAVAGLMSGAAFAQSNVTVYGVVDASYVNSSTGSMKRSGIESGTHDGSRLGFRGEEALGNGLKALFTLEYGLSSDVNAGVGSASFGSSAVARQQWVGLSGDFGTVSAGRVYGPLDDLNAFDSMDATMFSAMAALYPTQDAADPTRLSNAVKYVSPTVMGGLTVTGAYGFASYANDTAAYNSGDQERVQSIGLNYSAGPLAVQFVHQRVREQGTNTGDRVRDNALAASYDFGVAKLMGVYMTSKLDDGAATPADARLRQWNVGTVVPLTANGLLRVQYARLRDRENNNADARGWGIGYDHNLSKRTMVYVGYNRIGNDSAAAYEADGRNPAAAGDSARLYGLGIRHAF